MRQRNSVILHEATGCKNQNVGPDCVPVNEEKVGF